MGSIFKKELQNMNTLHLPATAEYFAVLGSKEDLGVFISFAEENSLSIFVLGGGSNVVIGDLENRLVLKNEISGIDVINDTSSEVLVRVGAGENWDSFVEWSVQKEYSGVEALSLIPGTVGAAPIQNVGAYGSEVADTIVSVSVYDQKKASYVDIENKDCDFSYRDSIFKKDLQRYIILGVVFRLSKSKPKSPDYKGVKESLDKKGINKPSLKDIREAVIAIRRSKLPDWNVEYNVGSFFGNPHISKQKMEVLKNIHEDMPVFGVGDLYKVPAGWLIEKAGLKGFEKGNFRIYEKHALVVVHSGEGDHKELAAFRDEIIKKVKALFDITLVQEPLEICKNN